VVVFLCVQRHQQVLQRHAVLQGPSLPPQPTSKQDGKKDSTRDAKAVKASKGQLSLPPKDAIPKKKGRCKFNLHGFTCNYVDLFTWNVRPKGFEFCANTVPHLSLVYWASAVTYRRVCVGI
jgi:hypothetical protein